MKAKRGLWFVASAALHIVLVLALLQAMLSPRSFIALFTRADDPMRPEQLTYVVPTPPVVATVPPPRAPVPQMQAPRLRVTPVAPRDVPSSLPSIPKATSNAVLSDSGLIRGSGNATGDKPLPTLNPMNIDPRLSGSGVAIAESPPLTGIEAMRAAIDSAMRANKDSLAHIRNPMDWTFGEGDKKFGMDQTWIYLGKIKIPTMLLGLIPMKGVQGNPQLAENSRTIGVMASEVRERGALARTRGEEIKSINARMERERQARLRAAAAGAGGGGDRKPPPQ